MACQPTASDKQRVWDLYQSGQPERVPVSLRTNDRVYVLDPRFNHEGVGYQDIFNDPEKMFTTQLQWQQLLHTYFRRYCDYPAGILDRWRVQAFFHNVYEAWALGCEVRFRPGQIPDTVPGYTDSVVLQQGMLDPGSYFLQKPFTPADLAHKVREALDT